MDLVNCSKSNKRKQKRKNKNDIKNLIFVDI